MHRRQFIKGLAILGGTALIENQARSRRGATDERKFVFFVAGSRYHKVNGRFQEGDTLRLVASTFRGEISFPVYTIKGAKIGHVPRALIPTLQEVTIRKSFLSRVDEFAVPWKRYEVTVMATVGTIG